MVLFPKTFFSFSPFGRNAWKIGSLCIFLFLGLLVLGTIAFSAFFDIEKSVNNFFQAGWKTLYAGNVDPENGEVNSDFTYNVKYYDPQGNYDTPASLKAHILKAGVEVANCDMSNTDESNKIYSCSKSLASPGADYRYYFEGDSLPFPYPKQGYLDGPVVYKTYIENANADSFIKSECPNKNFGNGDDFGDFNLFVGRWEEMDAELNRRTLIKFDLSSIPRNSYILSAKLNLFVPDKQIGGTPDNEKIYIHRITKDWKEYEVTWNNRDSQHLWDSPGGDFDPNISDSIIVKDKYDDGWKSFDVTSDVQLFVNGEPNYGWLLRDPLEGNYDREWQVMFRARENSLNHPYLEIKYVPGPLINEVYYDVAPDKGSESPKGTNEWIELYNPTSNSIDISGWQICDNNSCNTIPTGTSPIPANGFAVVTPDASTWNYWAIPEEVIKIVLTEDEIGNGLSNTGDRLILKDPNGNPVDGISYGSDTTVFNPSAPDVSEGHSLERKAPGWDTDSANDWQDREIPTPGQ